MDELFREVWFGEGRVGGEPETVGEIVREIFGTVEVEDR
jgi:hypothetical protein